MRNKMRNKKKMRNKTRNAEKNAESIQHFFSRQLHFTRHKTRQSRIVLGIKLGNLAFLPGTKAF